MAEDYPNDWNTANDIYIHDKKYKVINIKPGIIDVIAQNANMFEKFVDEIEIIITKFETTFGNYYHDLWVNDIKNKMKNEWGKKNLIWKQIYVFVSIIRDVESGIISQLINDNNKRVKLVNCIYDCYQKSNELKNNITGEFCGSLGIRQEFLPKEYKIRLKSLENKKNIFLLVIIYIDNLELDISNTNSYILYKFYEYIINKNNSNGKQDATTNANKDATTNANKDATANATTNGKQDATTNGKQGTDVTEMSNVILRF